LSIIQERRIPVANLASRGIFSPDGALLGIETGGSWAGVWGQKAMLFDLTAAGTFNSLAFSSDGRRILTVDEKAAKLWDAKDGKLERTFLANEILDTASLSQDQSLLATTGEGVVRVWDVTTARRLGPPLKLGDGPVHATFSPDARKLLTVGTAGARLWTSNGQPAVRLTGGPLEVGAGYDLSATADFAGDGRVALVRKLEVPVFDGSGRELVALPGHPGGTTVVRFSRDGELVATGGSDGTARIWDSRTGRPLAVLDAHQDAVNALAFSPDGRLLVTAAGDGTAIVWKVPS
jgi:WD40 repeat protein